MTAAAKKVMPISPRKFLQSDMRLAEYARPHFRILVDDTWTLEDVLEPAAWANVGAILQGKDGIIFPIVEVIWNDGSRYIELIVVDAGHLWAKVQLLRDVDLEESMAEVRKLKDGDINPDYEIKYKGPSARYAVLRKSDGASLHSNCATKDEAITWLQNYLKNLDKPA